MGKLVKFCSTCDEGFAERFGFCPNCGQTLQVFEMKPIVSDTPKIEEPVVEPIMALELETVEKPAEIIANTPPVVEIIEEPILEVPVVAEPIVETPTIEEPKSKAVAVPAAAFVKTTPVNADQRISKLEAERKAYTDGGGFYVTVIEEKNVGQRRVLLAGAFGLMVVVLMTGLVYNLFSKNLDIGSINDDIFNAVIVDEIPLSLEEELKLKKDKDGGGGGGGGRDEKEELTKGDLADQTPKPIRAPDAKVPRLDNPSLVLPPASTEGDRKFPKENDRFGDPNGRFTSFSNGTGTGGGQGTGVGTGQGSGRGTGTGSGIGSGSGSGLGSGNGSGVGDGDGDGPPPVRVGPTQGIKILSKPRPGYTDAARTANIQGTVILRVTFLASGQIGSISSIKGLPNGLTEQAIAAARRISFEPAQRNGVGQSVTKQIEYSFSIY